MVSNDYRNKHISNSDTDCHSKIHWLHSVGILLSRLHWQQVLRTSSERCPQVPKIAVGNGFSAGLRKQSSIGTSSLCTRRSGLFSLPKKMRCAIKWAKNKLYHCFPSIECSSWVPCEVHASGTGKLPVSSFRPFFLKKCRHHHLVQYLLL